MPKLTCLFSVIFLSLISLFASPVLAANYYGYFAADASLITLENAIGDEIEPGNLRFRLGAPVAPRVDIEAHLNVTLNSAELYQADWSSDIGALFLRANLPLGRYLAIYGIAGLSYVSITETLGRIEYYDDRSGFAYGFGIESVLTQQLDLTLDFVNYLHDDSVYNKVSAVSFGLKFYY